MRAILLFLSVWPLAAGPVMARNVQAFSRSMVECSVVLDKLVEIGRRRGEDPEQIEELVTMSGGFLSAAGPQAAAEGVEDTGAHLSALHRELSEKWDGRLQSIFSLRENLEWIDYCRAFATSRGIATPG